MNLYFLITGLSSGGAERNLLYICDDFSAKYDVTVVVMRDQDFYSDKFERLNCRVIYLQLNKGKIRPLISFILEFSKKRSRETILLSWLYHADLFSVILKLIKPKVKVYWNVRTAEIGKQFFRFSKPILLVLKIFSFVVPSKILYNSHRGKIEHENFGYSKSKGFVIKNIFVPPQPLLTSHSWKPEKGITYFGYVGRDTAQKGIKVMFEAFNCFNKKYPKSKLVVAGFDVKSSQWKKYETGNVIFIGKVTDIASFYNKINVLLLPSVYGEGTPNVILEALYFGLPCIGSNIGDVSLLLSDERGVVIKPGDKNSLIEALMTVVNTLRSENKVKKQKRKTYILEEFDKTLCIKKFENELFL